ncbi:MAG: hypothetical protein JXA90_16060, partial [Planctomycetes bacterium]|nr:hypothetical protein [Planctomycetota bacterium]
GRVRIVTPRLIAAAHRHGVEVHVWTVNDPVDAARWQMLGADSITTDRPAFIRESLLSPGLPRALRLWLPLDGDLRDASGRGRGGEPRGGSAQKMRFVEAVFGKGLDLGESGAAIALRCRLAERGTISLWYRPAPWYDHQTIVDSSAGENAWEMWIYRTGQLRFRIHPEGRGVSHSFHPTGDACEWHHIAVTWEKIGAAAAKLQLFANGHLADSTGEGSDRWLDPPEELFLGGGHPRNTPGRGIWDDVAVFDRPLRPAEIRFVMTAGAGALGARPQTGPR